MGLAVSGAASPELLSGQSSVQYAICDRLANADPPDQDSLECWVSLTWLADHSRRLEFGPLVSPLSFRNPTMLARQASAVDDLSNGRLTLGLGAGWQEREHRNYGLHLLDLPRRFKRLEEGLQVISSLLKSDEPINFDGEFFHLHNAILLPPPKRPGGPPILIGGSGPKRTLPLVARYASEWNSTFVRPERLAELNARLDELLVANGRKPEDVRRSVMTGIVFGRDEAEVQRMAADERGETVEQSRERGMIVGTGSQVVEQLGRLAEAGAQRVMLQWLALDDLDRLEALSRTLLPQVK